MIPTRFRRLPSLRLRTPAVWLVLAAAGALALLPMVLPHRKDPPRIPPVVLPEPVARPDSLLKSEERAAQLGIRPAASPAPAPEPGVSWGRRIIRHAALEIELDDVDRAIARLTDLVESAGGYVADTQVHSDEKGIARATVTAYLPPAAFGHALGDLERIGHLKTRRVTGQDVSEEFVDLEARVRNFERHEAQLLSFMGKAQKVSDLVSLENELARVRGEIERIRFLRARTEMAGIQVNLLRGTAPAPTEGAWARAWLQVRRAFVAGWKAAFEVAVGLAAVAAQFSPIAVPALVGWMLWRRRGSGLTISQS
jgi:Domain of unknown function (DUF4349)